MFDRLWTYLLYGNHFCGIEHAVKNEDEIIYAIILKQAKKELNVSSSFEGRTIADVSNKLSKNQHAALIINNEKVVFKTVESEQQDALKLVYKGFPNINLDDFYFEVLSQANTHFIALCRKAYVNELIDSYAQQKISIISLSLGHSLGIIAADFTEKDILYSSNARIEIENNRVAKVEKISTPSKINSINGISIFSSHLLSFLGALNIILNNNSAVSNFLKEKETLVNDYKQTHFFNQFLKVGGLFILLLLLVNFIFFNHYYTKVEELEQVSEINQSTKNQILKLKEAVSKKQKMVDDVLKSNGSKSSYYCDRIMQSLPQSILLSEFEYQPLLKRIKAENDIEIEEGIILVSGASNESESFSSWINQLEQKSWIDKVEIIDYGSRTSSTSDFTIEIILGNE